MIKRILSCLLSLIIVCSCFAVSVCAAPGMKNYNSNATAVVSKNADDESAPAHEIKVPSTTFFTTFIRSVTNIFTKDKRVTKVEITDGPKVKLYPEGVAADYKVYYFDSAVKGTQSIVGRDRMPETGESGYVVAVTSDGFVSVATLVRYIRIYTIQFSASGWENIPEDFTKTEKRDTKIPDTIPVKKDYTFICWKDGLTGKEYMPGDAYTADKNLVLNILFKKNVYKKGAFTYESDEFALSERVRDIAITGFDENSADGDILIIPSEIDGRKVTAIVPEVFKGCETITSVTIPGCVKYIGENNFEDCVNLTSVIIDSGVKYIGPGTFRNCTQLLDISIPDTVTYIHSNSIENTAYAANPDNRENGILYLSKCVMDTRESEIADGCAIKDGATVIADMAFCNSKIKSISFPSTLRYINDFAFYKCNGLVEVFVPESVVEIGVQSFSKCKNLETIKIRGNIKTVPHCAFAYCPALRSVYLPASVTLIYKTAFGGCDVLENIYYQGTESQWKSIEITKSESDLVKPFVNANIRYSASVA